MPAGRPPKFKSPEDLEAMLSEYFESEDYPTMTGLSLYLGFCDRQSLYDYEKREGFSCTIKKARTMIEHEYEKDLKKGIGNAGHIFALKNFGWSDKSQQEITSPDGSMTPSITFNAVNADKDD